MAAETGDGRESYQAPALEKGLEILEYLADQTSPHGMMDIATALGRSRNEIYRMLVVLERRGYIVRQEDRFELGNRMFEVAMRTPPRRNLHEAALPIMHRLSERLFQSCHLVVRSHDEMVVVARVESPDLLGFAVRIGYRRPIVGSTSGRLLFAFLPDPGQSAWRADLERTATPDEWRRFEADVDRVLRKGFHVGPSAFVDAVTDLGAPVFDGQTEGAAAVLVIPFVSGRSARSTVDEAVELLCESAAAISKRLRDG